MPASELVETCGSDMPRPRRPRRRLAPGQLRLGPLRHQRVDLLDELAELGIEAIARMRQRDRDLGRDPARIGGRARGCGRTSAPLPRCCASPSGSIWSGCGPPARDRAGRCAASPRSARRAPRTARPSGGSSAARPARAQSRRAGACRRKAPSDRRIRSRRGRSTSIACKRALARLVERHADARAGRFRRCRAR